MAVKWDLNKIRNLGISAHIDSGKTTLTERILFYSGRIHAIHDVRGKDGVGAKMDSMELERERGITIQSAATNVQWKTHQINIIDTPGHVDFTIEVERALRVLDGAVLILCGVAGVQSQSITVDRQMRRYNVPRIAFINKLDRSGANPFRVVNHLIDKLHLNAVMIQIPIGLEDEFSGVIDLIEMKAIYFEGPAGETIIEKSIPDHLLEPAKEKRKMLIEKLADFDDDIAEKYLIEQENEISIEQIQQTIRKATIELKLVPVMLGSAYKNKGIQKLLDAVCAYLPNPKEIHNEALDLDENEKEIPLESDEQKPLVALAFKLEDGRYGQLTYMRIYQGTLNKGDFIYNTSTNKKVKVPRIIKMHADEMQEIETGYAGDIVACFGVDCASGDTFTDGKVNYAMTSMHVPEPVISFAIQPIEKNSAANFTKALQKFRKEDPTFRVHRDEESSETIISGMGELHLDVYVERMKREFSCAVKTGQPQVAYRESITDAASFDYTHRKQTGGAGQYAKVVGEISPLTTTGEQTYEFETKIVGGKIPKEYIPAVDKGCQEQFCKGTLIGFPVVGIKVTLTDGSYHEVDSSEMAFRLCAMGAMRQAYEKAKPTALEPLMKLEVSSPEEYQGNVMSGINQRRGIIIGSQVQDDFATIQADVPLSEMFGYATDLRSATQGKGEFTMEFSRYAPVPKNIQEQLVKNYQQKKAKST